MKHKPVLSQSSIATEIVAVVFMFFLTIAFLASGAYCGVIITAVPLIVLLLRLPKWLQSRNFKHLSKETAQACITECKIVSSSSGKGGISHTYYVTYSFETVEGNGPFIFIESVSELTYNQVQVGTKITVKYAIADPRLACSSLSTF